MFSFKLKLQMLCLVTINAKLFKKLKYRKERKKIFISCFDCAHVSRKVFLHGFP